MSPVTRRDVLATGAGVAVSSSVVGCISETGSSSPSIFTSFFPLYDFTTQIVGDHMPVENAVPPGEHGHGWEPRVDLLPDIVDSAAFVFLDARGFQPWAEEAAAAIRTEYSDDMQIIDALEGIDILEYEGAHHDEYDHDPTETASGSVAELEVIDQRSGDIVAHFHFDHWHGAIPQIKVEDELSLGARFVDGGGHPFPLDDDSPYDFVARLDSQESNDVRIHSEDDHIVIAGTTAKTISVVFALYEDETRQWETDPIDIEIVDERDYDGDRAHGLYDVKFFSDPVLAKQGVRTIRDGIIELDPENEDMYRQNAASYIDELDALHTDFRRTLADRSHDRVVLAGHDSFHYLGQRYGFEIHTPVGLSPDDEPSSRDIAAAIDLVEEHDIEYVLWDHFDGARVANAIKEESATVEDTAMVSAAENFVSEWKEEGKHDYIGQMRHINLPAFKKALGAI